MEEYYQSHYIRTDEEGRIIHGFSSAFEDPQIGDIQITDKGGRHFQLRFTDDTLSEENPPLRIMEGIPLYKVDGETILERTPEEIEADRQDIPPPPISDLEQLRADVDYIAMEMGVDLDV
jgi:hypothetical protein